MKQGHGDLALGHGQAEGPCEDRGEDRSKLRWERQLQAAGALMVAGIDT